MVLELFVLNGEVSLYGKYVEIEYVVVVVGLWYEVEVVKDWVCEEFVVYWGNVCVGGWYGYGGVNFVDEIFLVVL